MGRILVGNALDGVKVIEFSNAYVGPVTSKQLGDYGATVIRVESPLRPDPARTSQPYKDNKPGLNRGGYYAYYSGNKYGMALDLNNKKGMEVLKRLLRWADVVIENFRPGVMEKWNLGYEQIKRINPGIVMLRTSNQGQTGPYSSMRGVGNGLNGLTGLVHLTGWPDRPPSVMMLAYSDYLVPFLGAMAIIAALDYRRRTGKGQLVDMSQFEAGLQFVLPPILEYTVNGRETQRMGNANHCAAPHGAYRCKGEDRWCAIAVSDEEKWQILCRLMGNPSWTQEDRFKSFPDRKKNEADLNHMVESWTVNYEPEELMSLLQKAGIPAGVVKTPKDIFVDPQLRHRNFFWQMDHPEMGPFHHLGQSSVLSKTPAQGRMPAPCLGEHTEFICSKFLQISEEEFVELLSDGAFG
jgi:benzylsuccinate CoA-transferase BbsF subunit